MKRKLCMLLVSVLCIGMLAGCGSEEKKEQESSSGKKQEIKIGTSSLQLETLEVAKKEFDKSDKYVMKIQLFDDAITPNIALTEGSIDANFYQHIPFMEAYNRDKGTDIKPYGDVIVGSPIGIFSDKHKSLDDIKDGATIAVANDTTNRGVALEFLQDLGLIKLKDGVEVPSALDIVDNKHNIKLVEMERLGLEKALADVDYSVMVTDIYFNAGRDVSDAIAMNDEDSIKSRGIVVGVRGDQEDTEWLQLLEKSLKSDSVKKFINDKYKGSKVPLF